MTNPTEMQASDAVDGLTYEQAREQLVQVVQSLESGSATLEESLALWERGNALAERCEAWLQGAKARLDAAKGSQPEAEAPVGEDAP